MNSNSKTPKDILILANLMDTKFQGPFGFRFGLDGIIGLIPVLGDASTAVVSLYIILRAAMLKVPLSIILHMLLNVLFEFLIGLIPFLGDAFDFFWKANTKNLKLVSNHLEHPVKTKSLSLLKIGSTFFIVFFLLGSVFYLFFYLIKTLISFI